MTQCVDCPHCKIGTNGEYMSFAKCMKTSKKGRMIDWAMTTLNLGTGEKTEGENWVRKSLQRRKAPAWCPILAD